MSSEHFNLVAQQFVPLFFVCCRNVEPLFLPTYLGHGRSIVGIIAQTFCEYSWTLSANYET
jgi:hypothetical protein